MKNKILLLLSLLLLMFLLNGCEYDSSTGTAYSGEVKYSKICIDGVEYLKLRKSYQGYMSAHFKTDGTLYLCGEKPSAENSHNSLSWDVALVSMAAGGLERRLSWNWDARFVLAYDPEKTHLNLNKMKLVMCFSSQCDRLTAEAWKPSSGDKSANNWVPSIQSSVKD